MSHQNCDERASADVGIAVDESGRWVRLESLTGLRFLAAAVVFMHHGFTLTAGTLRGALQSLFSEGRAGVSFFFILSGFVLAWSWSPEDRPVQFYRRRIARIWPAYAVAVVLGYGVSRWFDHKPFSLGRLVADVAMLQSWVPAQSWYFSTDGVCWSVSVELFFYLTFPLYIRQLLRLSGRTAGLCAATCVLGTLAVGLILMGRVVLAEGWILPDSHSAWLVYVCPVARTMEFLLGILLVVIVRSGSLPRIPVPVAWVTLAVGWFALPMVPGSLALVAVPVVPFALLILAYAAKDLDERGSTVWSSRVLVWLGTISYCFYLVHQMVMRVFKAMVTPHWLWTATGGRDLKVLALIFTVSVLAAWALHTLVERPAERLLRGRQRNPIPSLPLTCGRQPPEGPADRYPPARIPTHTVARPASDPVSADDRTYEIPRIRA